MKRGNRTGSALVITMMILVILTAAGLYAVGLSTSGIETASVAEEEQAAMNAAEAGLYYGIDRFPFLSRERGIRLPNGAKYDVTVSHTGTVPVPGYDMGWAQALYRVRAVGRPPNDTGIRRTAEAEATFGPVQAGTQPLGWDAVPEGSLIVSEGPPSPFYHDSRDPSSRGAFVRRYAERNRILLPGFGNGILGVVDAGSSTHRYFEPGWDPPAGSARTALTVADIRVGSVAGEVGRSTDTGWRTLAVAGVGGEEGGYFAYDITGPGSGGTPAMLWRIPARTLPILGESRSTPAIGKIRMPSGRQDALGTTVERWVILVGAEKGILVLEAATGRIVQLLSDPAMGEVAASPSIALDREGYIDRVYVGDLSGKVWRAVANDAGRFDLGGGPFFSITREDVVKTIRGKCAIVPGEGPYPGLWIYFGTGDPVPLPDGRTGGIFAVYDGVGNGGDGGQRNRAITERDLADATPFFARIHDPESAFPVPERKTFRGWFAFLPMTGEWILSGPRVFFYNLFVTSYTPASKESGEHGIGRIYGFGIAPGKNLGNPALFDRIGSGAGMSNETNGAVRVRKVGVGGIPSSPVISIGDGATANLLVRVNGGEMTACRVPAPGRRKSVSYWQTFQEETRRGD